MLEHNTIKLTGRLVEADDWDEERINARTSALIETLLKVWPVPGGHQGQVVDPETKTQDWIDLKDLMAAGLLRRGDRLVASHRDVQGIEASLGGDARIHLDGRAFRTPSGAANQLRKRATNGWYFWSLADGRRLRDVRAEYLSALTSDSSSQHSAL